MPSHFWDTTLGAANGRYRGHSACAVAVADPRRRALPRHRGRGDHPPRLVIVSFRDGKRWVTRTYDNDALPPAMRQIYGIIGERFESKRKR